MKKIKNLNSKKIYLRKNTLGSPFRRIPDTKKIQEIVNIKNFISLNEGLKKQYYGIKKNKIFYTTKLQFFNEHDKFMIWNIEIIFKNLTTEQNFS